MEKSGPQKEHNRSDSETRAGLWLPINTGEALGSSAVVATRPPIPKSKRTTAERAGLRGEFRPRGRRRRRRRWLAGARRASGGSPWLVSAALGGLRPLQPRGG